MARDRVICGDDLGERSRRTNHSSVDGTLAGITKPRKTLGKRDRGLVSGAEFTAQRHLRDRGLRRGDACPSGTLSR